MKKQIDWVAIILIALGLITFAWALSAPMVYGAEIEVESQWALLENDSDIDTEQEGIFKLRYTPFETIGIYIVGVQESYKTRLMGMKGPQMDFTGIGIGYKSPSFHGIRVFGEWVQYTGTTNQESINATTTSSGIWEGYQYLFQKKFGNLREDPTSIKFNEYQHVMQDDPWSFEVGMQYNATLFNKPEWWINSMAVQFSASYKYFVVDERFVGYNPPYTDYGCRKKGTPGYWEYSNARDLSSIRVGIGMNLSHDFLGR